jgi:hypothetical protein
MSRTAPKLALTAFLALFACDLDREPHPSETFGARAGDAATDGGDAAALDAGSDSGAVEDAGRDAGSGGGGTGGTGGAGTGGEDAGGGPCAPGCPDAMPVCLDATGACVECASDSHCHGAGAPICDRERHVCVQCSENAHCDESVPHCDPTSGECAECLRREDCEDPEKPHCDADSHTCTGCVENADCGGSTPLCNQGAQRCVECLAPADCTDPAKPQCAGGVCMPCSDDRACAGRAETTLCDTDPASPSAGRCIECTASNEAPCHGTVCDPVARSCTDRLPASKGTCHECIADSECVADHRCVALEYQGQPREHAYCMKRTAAGCARPFAATPLTRASRSGAAAETYCGIDELSTTCEAITALVDDTACGEHDAACVAPGAMCRSVNGVENRCTYSCGAASQCPAGFTCGAGYCGSM